MSQVEESIEVDVPVRTAYNQWTQFADFPQFMDGVERIEQRTDTLTHWVTKIGGVQREFDAEITEQIPDERVAWTTVNGEAKQAGVVTFHRLDDTRTKVMLQLDYDPQGLAETVGDKLGFVKRQATGDLKRFKEFIESRGGAETGAWRGEV
ncbi:SRPBCC family protein [Streptomyces glomeratus]|uniref:SRPBCC family protein n=1 Tax=Streptomyces glomeratus TaxID=284452 RepID=A0ABP6LLT0_9ACTN|nr:SRPBCC family protein [Streptomyces glomeratus]MCF1510474.1 SRPBCC family protein [Streptomyces glomeratus]